MATQFVSKARLLEQLRDLIDAQETGFLTILTDTNRSVLLRFSVGRLTRLHCRSKEAGEAIQVLAECAMVKFTYASAPEDTEPELMPTASFLQLIDPGGDAGASLGNAAAAGDGAAINDPIKMQMLEIATEYVGVVADMIVDEAFDDGRDVLEAIEYISQAIPDANQSRAFRAAAREHFSSIDV